MSDDMAVESDLAEASPNGEALVMLLLSAIRPNPDQPRKSFPKKQMDELMESIRTSGLVQPIVVRPLEEGVYQLVAGERRWRAFRQLATVSASFRRIPAVVRHIEDADLPVVSLIENIVRDDLNPIERAEALHSLRTHLGATWEQVAHRVGISVRAVHFLTGTLKLREEFKAALAAGEITEKHGRALQRLASHEQAAYELFEYVRSAQITGDEAVSIAAVLRKFPTMSAEEAHQYLKSGAVKVPKAAVEPKPAPAAGPADQLSKILRQALKAAGTLDPAQLSQDERNALLQTLDPGLLALRSLLDLIKTSNVSPPGPTD